MITRHARQNRPENSRNSPMNAAIGLGANREKPKQTILKAVDKLRQSGFADIRLSSFYLTEPEDCRPGTPDFVNAAVVGLWPASPEELLAACRKIERELGRPAEHAKDEARTIDLDILMFDDQYLHTESLRVPHPLLTERLFVLTPLSEIAGDWIVGKNGIKKSVKEWKKTLKTNNPDAVGKVRFLCTVCG